MCGKASVAGILVFPVRSGTSGLSSETADKLSDFDNALANQTDYS